MGKRLLTLCVVALLLPRMGFSQPELWDRYCSSCHADDTPTCNGCHNHRGELSAQTARPEYRPGELVEIEFDGGTEHGWVRALIYDETGEEVVRLAGPTGSGDDALGQVASADSVAFPLRILAQAPTEPGTYQWRAAYFGIYHVQQVTHHEEWTPFTLTVIDPDSLLAEPSWGTLKHHYRP